MKRRFLFLMALFLMANLLLTSSALAATSEKSAQSNGYTLIVKDAVLYRSPNTKAEVIYNIDGKQEIEIIGHPNDAWYKARYKDKTGYVQAELVRNTMFVLEDDRVYAAPAETRTLTEVENGLEVEILGRHSDEWYKVRFENKTGYMKGSNLSLKDPMIENMDTTGLLFGTLHEKDILTLRLLYRDRQLSEAIINQDTVYPLPQRVVVLENGKRVKKIAAFGYEAYVPAENIKDITKKYVKETDESALEQYVLTLRAKELQELWKDDPYFARLTYDENTETCVVHYKEGQTPPYPLKPGFRLQSSAFSQADIADALKIIEDTAQKYGFVKKKDYGVNIIERLYMINVYLIDDAGRYMERFENDLIRAGIDQRLVEVSLTVV